MMSMANIHKTKSSLPMLWTVMQCALTGNTKRCELRKMRQEVWTTGM